MSQDIFFELGLEELPSGLVKPLAKELLAKVTSSLEASGVAFEKTFFYSTPRRIAFLIENVSTQQPTKTGTKRGPAQAAAHDNEGKPTQALLGFARSCGVPVEALRLETQEKGAWWVYDFEEKGLSTKECLPALIQESLLQLTIPKPMRWGGEKYHFARPAHWAILMYGHEYLHASILGINTQDKSYGHRFLHPQALVISSPKNYETQLKDAKVWVDFNARRKEIIRQIQEIESSKQWHIPLDEDLLDEITSIVEWPEVMVGRFAESFLEVPEAVLIASMKEHQKCLPIYDQKGALMPFFVFVSNIKSIQPESVIHGNEKVMRARLSDAAFFYEQDRKKPLIEYALLTETVLFEKRLGSLADKTARVKKIVGYLIPHLGLDADKAMRAVDLSKCDLMTQMVNEFPELQGQIGEYYASKDNEALDIPRALFEQYLPRFSGDVLPETDLGFVLSLADRIDTLVGIFAIGMKPTGEKDPYKLRRHALAVVRLLLQKPNQLNIAEILKVSAQAFDFLNIEQAVLDDLKKFMTERMQSHYQSHQYPVEWFLAGLSVQNEQWYDLSLRLTAFREFMQFEHSQQLFQSAKRIRQILAQVSEPLNGEVDASYFQEPAEKQLWYVLGDVKAQLDEFLNFKNYAQAFHLLLSLSEPLNAFFENVFVMAEDLKIRNNRLNLLFNLQKVLYTIVALGS